VKRDKEELNLPRDLVQFLEDGRQLTYDSSLCECGLVRLLPLNQLVVEEFYVDSEGGVLEAIDPHRGEKGYYRVTAVDLVADCEGYDPKGILIWLPELELFGTWDIDHWDMLVFPGVTWKDIAANPERYLNAQWYPTEVDHELLKLWSSYPFHSRKPPWA
jgi:hypothetical protein